MKYLTVVALLLHFLFVAQSAPISWFQPPPAFTEASERAKTLLEKILRDITAVHAAAIHLQGLTLDPPTQTTDLQLMAATLGLPTAPVLKPPSEHFTLDVCVSRMLAGSRLYQGLLGVLSDRLSGLSDLQADLRDLHTHISKMKEAAQLDTGVPDQNQSLELGSRLEGDYNTQVALHLTLTRLRSFCHDLSRSLRAVATYRLRAAAAR